MAKNYANLEVTDQVRVNAVILRAFETNPDNFVSGFRAQVKKHAAGDATRHDGFQEALGHLRDYLAADIKNLPKLEKNSLADDTDLMAQKSVFRALREVMGHEKKGAEYSALQIAENVQRVKNVEGKNNGGKLPEPTTLYHGFGEMLAKSQALEACKDTKPLAVCIKEQVIGKPLVAATTILSGGHGR